MAAPVDFLADFSVDRLAAGDDVTLDLAGDDATEHFDDDAIDFVEKSILPPESSIGTLASLARATRSSAVPSTHVWREDFFDDAEDVVSCRLRFPHQRSIGNTKLVRAHVQPYLAVTAIAGSTSDESAETLLP